VYIYIYICMNICIYVCMHAKFGIRRKDKSDNNGHAP